MPIRAVVFDIGGVLELTEPGSLERIWEPRLGAAGRDAGLTVPASLTLPWG
jgi:hypothetical protein